MAERDDKGFFIRIDWNVNDIRLLNDISIENGDRK